MLHMTAVERLQWQQIIGSTLGLVQLPAYGSALSLGPFFQDCQLCLLFADSAGCLDAIIELMARGWVLEAMRLLQILWVCNVLLLSPAALLYRVRMS